MTGSRIKKDTPRIRIIVGVLVIGILALVFLSPVSYPTVNLKVNYANPAQVEYYTNGNLVLLICPSYLSCSPTVNTASSSGVTIDGVPYICPYSLPLAGPLNSNPYTEGYCTQAVGPAVANGDTYAVYVSGMLITYNMTLWRYSAVGTTWTNLCSTPLTGLSQYKSYNLLTIFGLFRPTVSVTCG